MNRYRIRDEVVIALKAATPHPANLEARDVTADTPIGEGGFGIDSLALLHAFVALETRFGIVFDDRTVASMRFDSIGAIERLIGSALAGTEPPRVPDIHPSEPRDPDA
ncbi:acyl carrier protein [uncultured Methylobacterium sp.]|uniref:acyl carrier protein n=1 Tax=uncultured Methylobacterium sp. TaxID=157278 RepID=UPI00258B963E|nr:acyl carrier protein [uncultured Methylobacterium sp.]